MTPGVENILAVYHRATPEQISEGMVWYEAAHALAAALDPNNISQAAGVIAALSPMVRWDANERFAIMAYESGGNLGSVCLGANVAKANRIVKGEPAGEVLGGDKVISFWQSIADPSNPNTMAVIDRHAYDIAVGKVCEDKERKLGKKRYREFAACYAEAAAQLGIGAAQLQAITWVTWRAEKGIK